MTNADVEFLKTLAPPDPDWQGTGSLKLHPDPRDYPLSLIPQVAAVLAAGVPETADLTGLVKGAIYNQGALPSCVAHSTAGLNSMDDVAENSRWEVFDAVGMYHAAGGDGSNGVDTRLVLQQAVDNGVPILGGGGRVKLIGAYAFAPQVPGAFREALKAAIAAGQPCTLALLLPSNFGWDSSGAVSSGYHQVIAVAYDATWVTILNSWGNSWGKNGLGRVPWDYLEAGNLQNHYCYSCTTTQLKLTPQPDPKPEPKPEPQPNPTPVAVVISAKVTGSNLGSVAVGPGYQLSGNGLVWPLEVTHMNGPTPDPKPQPQPDPQPDSLKVNIFRQASWLYVTVQDAAGKWLAATITATGGTVARAKTTPLNPTAIPAVVRLTGTGSVTITATTEDGRTGTATT